MSIVQEYAMPRTRGKLTPTQINRIKALAASGARNADIAEALNINVSTVIQYTRGDGAVD
jgi:DNA-binding CsgD family transcriptional regulator